TVGLEVNLRVRNRAGSDCGWHGLDVGQRPGPGGGDAARRAIQAGSKPDHEFAGSGQQQSRHRILGNAFATRAASPVEDHLYRPSVGGCIEFLQVNVSAPGKVERPGVRISTFDNSKASMSASEKVNLKC